MYSKNVKEGGFYFRSHLEARWYNFFHYLGVPLKYEEETYNLPNHMKYVPDFKLYGFHDSYLWAEVKGVNNMQELITKENDYKKIKSFHEMGHSVIVLPSFPENINQWVNMRVTTLKFVNGESDPCIPYYEKNQIKLLNKIILPEEIENINKALYYAKSIWLGDDNY